MNHDFVKTLPLAFWNVVLEAGENNVHKQSKTYLCIKQSKAENEGLLAKLWIHTCILSSLTLFYSYSIIKATGVI